ncbi:amphoterin-induced protein 3-like isoform X1 [Seriola lalandi dorsalis]|uniref:amphoterin-induced protein 3 n=1 Tax=Seriola aureovittata TaxID=2871759 RepID=UPI000C6F782D|nr:amphoterin-induced protein 3-like isoform X1 [Seriola lalandi dorsalis]XP_056243180.1 amphoterin-induced protein 3 [Seriola aureovittata]
MLYVVGNAGFLQGVVAPLFIAASQSWWSIVVLLVCLQLPQLSPVQATICQSQGSSQAGRCLCASDILSCTALGLEQVPREMPVSAVTLDLSHNQIDQLKGGAFEGLSRLETLRLAHNQLTTIHEGAFQNTSGALLRHLDLSSNQLRVLEQHYFQELSGLEELLLFNNRIVQVESRALAGLGSLRKAYLSHNRLTHFPFFSIQEHSHPHLIMLDLSSNRLLKLPLEDILNLPIPVQRGLYLHNNSLECECSMYGLFRRWEQRGYDSVKHFRQEHTCRVYGIQKGTVRFFQHGRYFEKCNLTAMNLPLREQESSVSVSVGKALLLHCVTTLTGRSVTFLWVSPNLEYVAPPGNNGSFKMFTNGSLEIVAARAEDSGVYWCMALDQQQQRNETREVNVTVVLHHESEPHESFNTGFTTLLGCVVSLVLVLMYLYLTPCRCPPCPKALTPATPSVGNEAGVGSAQSSILTPTPPATTEGPGRKVSTNKHVVFLEPIREQQNGRLRAGPGTGAVQGHLGPSLLLGPEQHPKLHSQSQQRAGETDSIMSVFSDTPIMLP